MAGWVLRIDNLQIQRKAIYNGKLSWITFLRDNIIIYDHQPFKKLIFGIQGPILKGGKIIFGAKI